MTRRVPRTRAFAPDPAAPPGRPCDMPGCERFGEYRAPKSRRNLKDYWWFCLEHVRAYNSTWDYYKGMSPGEIEAQLRADTAWQRDRKSTRLNSSHPSISYAVFCLKKKK